MTRDELNALLEILREAEDTINETKGEGYANDQDALANFKRAAQYLGLSPLQICGVYMIKHFDAIMNYAKLGKDITGENLMGRVVDLRLFAALFLALAREDAVATLTPVPDAVYYQDHHVTSAEILAAKEML